MEQLDYDLRKLMVQMTIRYPDDAMERIYRAFLEVMEARMNTFEEKLNRPLKLLVRVENPLL